MAVIAVGPVDYPDVRGMTSAQALVALAAVLITPQFGAAVNNPAEEGLVVTQTPDPAENPLVDADSVVVVLVLSLGPAAVTPPPPIPVVALGNRVVLPAKAFSSNLTLSQFNFLSRLSPGETITDKVISAVVYQGDDPNPGALFNGAPVVNGTIVTQSLSGGVLGTIYQLLCSVVTSLNRTIDLAGYLAVVPDP